MTERTMGYAPETVLSATQIYPETIENHCRWDRLVAQNTCGHMWKIGTPLRAEPCSPGRIRTSNLLITRSPRFPSDVDYLIAIARHRALGTGRLVSEPSRGVSSGLAADCLGARAL